MEGAKYPLPPNTPRGLRQLLLCGGRGLSGSLSKTAPGVNLLCVGEMGGGAPARLGRRATRSPRMRTELDDAERHLGGGARVGARDTLLVGRAAALRLISTAEHESALLTAARERVERSARAAPQHAP